MTDDPGIWPSLLRAAETEPQQPGSIRGASGLAHPVIALGVDDGRRRLLVVSGEHDARAAAMAQADIQAALTGTQVIVARPIAVNLADLAHSLSDVLGKSVVEANDLTRLPQDQAEAEKLLAPVLGPV